MEPLKGLWALTSTEIEHGDSSSTSNGECRSASRIAIKLRQDQTGWIRNGLEAFCNAERLLPCCSVKNKDALTWVHCVTQI
jgi:hypothetical protein